MRRAGWEHWCITDDGDETSLGGYMLRYLKYLEVRNYSPHTIKGYNTYLGYLQSWAEDRNILKPQEVTRPMLERYLTHIHNYRGRDDKPLSNRGKASHIRCIKPFFSWMAKNHYLLYNPASELEPPKIEKRLPKAVLTASEADAIINSIDPNSHMSMRDRAILEILYSTGMRRSELVNLTPKDIDRERGTVLIRQGKGHKDRMVPIGDRALAWLNRYIEEKRSWHVVEPDEKPLFLNNNGTPLTTNRLSQLVRTLVDKADIGKRGACHLFRHTMATVMLEGGADIRYIQEMLGHSKLETTQIYTQVSIRKLKEVHEATHPAKLPE